MTANLGINVAFPPKRCDPVAFYRDAFVQMNRRHLRVCRIWMSDFSFNYYSYGGFEHNVNLPELERIVAAARELQIQFIPVLFDFNEFSNTNVIWREFDHTFENSFLGRVVSTPEEFFLAEHRELGLSKFEKALEIFGTSAVAWELFNEIDLVEGFSLDKVDDWVCGFTDLVAGRCGGREIYLSFANPNCIEEASRRFRAVRLAIHTYKWPYLEFHKNVIYWQGRFPDCWIMECGSRDCCADDVVVAAIASWLLNKRRQVAMPWFWNRVLQMDAVSELGRVLELLERHVPEGSGVRFVGSLGPGRVGFRPRELGHSLRLGGMRNLWSKACTVASTWYRSGRSEGALRFEGSGVAVIVDRGEAPSSVALDEAVESQRIGNVTVAVVRGTT